MKDIKLTEITGLREFMALNAVRVKERQRRFTKNLFISFMQTRHPAVTFYRVDWQGQPVAYVMLIHAQQPTQWIIERLTVDREHQRQGLGYAIADHLIDMIHGFENSEMVIARYEPENGAARKLFAKLNFEEQEELFRDRHVAVLKFEFEEVEDEDEDEAAPEDKAKNADAEAAPDEEDEKEDEEDADEDADEEDEDGDGRREE